MNRLRQFLAVGLCVALLSSSSGAWNSFGHMTVAYVAYQHLTPKTKKRVATLLKKNPRYNSWASQVPAGTSAEDKNMMIFMLAATWPDLIKGDHSYQDDGPDNGNRPPNDPSASQNIGYSDHLRHKYWHFVDTPFSTDNTKLEPIPNPNAATQIAAFRATLASSSPDALKSYDLVWLLHLVGDVHQLLHATSRFTTQDPDGDAGGNMVKVCPGQHCALHGFWDDQLGTNDKFANVIAAGKALHAPNAQLAKISDEQKWINESFVLAQSKAYAAPIEDGNGPFTLTAKYKKTAKKTASERVSLAGVRLANLLNQELK
ncbi:MAG TPA: S1/P1 nuclease [Terriglobales bacterium]|nr:S1/P1 nuclease [Terriglobales bacterium]